MKKISLKHAAALTMGASVFLSGCSKQEAPAPATSATTANQPSATVNESIDAARKSAEDATAEAQKQAAQIKASADAAVADSKKEAEKLKEASVTTTTEVTPPPVPAAPAPATPAATTGQSQAMTVLTQAKTLYTEKKYPEALAALGGLQNVSLTAEEQTMVNQLKTQISNALAAQGANEGLKSVGGLLQPK